MTTPPAKMNWWYESVSDWLIQNPEKTLKDCAATFNATPQWIYILTKATAFREYHEGRRADHNYLVSVGVIDKAEAVADMALDHLATKMAEQGELLPVKTLTEVADTMLSRMGYGGRGGPSNGGTTQGAISVHIDVGLLNQARAAHQSRIAGLPMPGRPPDLSKLVEGAEDLPLITLEPSDVNSAT